MADTKSEQEVYEDRNILVCGLIASNPDLPGGWMPAPDIDSLRWAVAWIETPAGQASWHIPRQMAERHLERDDSFEYDGHECHEKNGRLSTWVTESLSDSE